jgi:regulator of replication initiation timing
MEEKNKNALLEEKFKNLEEKYLFMENDINKIKNEKGNIIQKQEEYIFDLTKLKEELSKHEQINYGQVIFKIEEFSKFASEKENSYRYSDPFYIHRMSWAISVCVRKNGFLGYYLYNNEEGSFL